MDISELPAPKRARDWAIGLAVVLLLGALVFAVYQLRIDRGEAECRDQCAAAGKSGYIYVAPAKRVYESCTCAESR